MSPASSRDRRTDIADPNRGVYVISVAAELSGLHAQTLRQYDRLGLVSPQRTGGGGRRYSQRDIEQLRLVQELSNDGVSLAGIQRIMDLQSEVDELRHHVAALTEQVGQYRQALDTRSRGRVFTAGRDGVVQLRQDETMPKAPGNGLVLYRSRPESGPRRPRRGVTER